MFSASPTLDLICRGPFSYHDGNGMGSIAGSY